jgi:diadenylate cyclase
MHPGTTGTEELKKLIDELIRSCQVLTQSRIGALIVIEKSTGIQEFVDTGVKIDGVVSSEFLINLFIPKSPLHDGAVIIRGDRVAAAGCFLPLTQDTGLQKDLGTRQRAALGLSEVSDALVIIVSEETGVISVAKTGS